ncbi:PQQ-dependent sugar dehydrogenase [Nocardioides cheoyonin]|uniref:PQQ-dependent sugar dehydrogenase n=1 Tax=Nocardioides cheoyonin TaxID=3156615 RepID=UPI0032B4A132
MRALLGLVIAATLSMTALPAAACTVSDAADGAAAGPGAKADPAARTVAKAKVPKLRVWRMAGGLDHPWDVVPVGNQRFLVTQRERARLTLIHRGHKRTVKFPSGRIWVSGETGLMGLEVDPAFTKNHRIYTCSGWKKSGGGHDVRVIAWKLDPGLTRARMVRTLVAGFPTSTGRHGGCRLLISRNGALHVGTGDAAQGRNPRSLTSLGGKTLRLNRFTGKPWPSNPWVNAKSAKKRYITSYGHRNVQGITQRSNGSIWTIEQGTYRDDEVNRLVIGGDYGYNPVPGYNESVPMTDQSLPGKQIAARWRSGNPTIATSGGTFLPSKGWGALNGALAVAVLKDHQVRFLSFSAKGKLVAQRVRLTHRGRIRTAVVAPNGDLLVTTDRGGGKDVVLRVHPR